MADPLSLTTGMVYVRSDTPFTLSGGITITTPGVLTLPQGTAATPPLNFGTAGTGFWGVDTNYIGIASGGVARLEMGVGGIYLRSDGVFTWSATTDPNGSDDLGISRISAGLMGIGNGVTGDFSSSLKFTNATVVGKAITYNNVATAGWGIPAVYKTGRVTAQSAANASISTYTVGAADGSFEVSANMNVTASTVLTTTLTCTYTDESNTARTMIFPVAAVSGSFVAAGAISGAGASVWETPVMHIRCKASTAITILTSAGTFTGVTYTAEGIIKQTA